jgi:hypothetical protein
MTSSGGPTDEEPIAQGFAGTLGDPEGGVPRIRFAFPIPAIRV